jgi:hypothetical protein
MAAALAVAVPAELAARTAGRAVAVLSGAAGAVPAAVLSLTEGVVKAMVVKWKLAAVAVAAGLGLTGLGAWNGTNRAAVAAADERPAAKPAPQRGSGSNVHLIGFVDAGTVPEKPTPPVAAGPVATIFGDVPVTREAFAEHLIARYGKKELELFVSKQIIAHAFARKGWTISADDVQAALDADLKAAGVASREQFEKDVLPQHGKTMAEWVEDVITPRLMLARLCREQVAPPTEEELRAMFDAKHGEKRECRMILCPTAEDAAATHKEASAGGEAFDRAVRRQHHSSLAAGGGLFPPVPTVRPAEKLSKFEEAVHAAVTALRPGEVSRPVAIEGAFLVIKCDKVIPADGSKSFEVEKLMLLKEVLDARINREVPRLMDELKREANAKYLLTFPDPVKQ